jgi:hypothetical protein
MRESASPKRLTTATQTTVAARYVRGLTATSAANWLILEPDDVVASASAWMLGCCAVLSSEVVHDQAYR